MEITVQLTKADFAELEVTESQLRAGIVQLFDRGIDLEDDGTLYLSGFNVDVQVIKEATMNMTQMTKHQMLDRVAVLSSEIDANEEENRVMQAEIDSLYSQIDATA